MRMAKSSNHDLEASFAQLQATISKLEDEKTTLQESLNAFEKGIKLTRQAQQTLLEAEQKVKLLLEIDGAPDSQNFSETDPE